MNRFSRIFNLLFTAPQTWMALLVIIGLEWGFFFWFRPPFTMSAAALGMGSVMLLAWPAVYFRSETFRRRYHGMPEAMEMGDLKRMLSDCEPAFRQPALACLDLARRIQEEFPDQEFLGEIDRVLENLKELSRNHRELRERSRTFGTQRQKQAMRQKLAEQAESVEDVLTALNRFSGNLTLFDQQIRDQKEIDGELEAINLGLQDAMKEI